MDLLREEEEIRQMSDPDKEACGALRDSDAPGLVSREMPSTKSAARDIALLLERWIEKVWNDGNETAVDELTAADVAIHDFLDGDGERIYDTAAFKKMFWLLRSDLSGVKATVELKVVEGDMVAARCVITAIHSGDSPGRVHWQPIHFTGMIMLRVRGGRIAEIWNHFDFETMCRQME